MTLKSKPIKIIIVFLSVVMLLTILLQVSRSDFFLTSSSNAPGEQRPSLMKSQDALAPDRLEALNQENYLILYDDNDPASQKISESAELLLRQMKKNVRVQKISEAIRWGDKPDAVIVAAQDYSLLPDLDRLLDYVDRGGRVLMSETPLVNDAFYRLYRKLGILEFGNYENTHLISFQRNVLIGYGAQQFDDKSLENSLLRVKLDDRAEVLASGGNDLPMIWQMKYGSGTFLVFNGTMFGDKTSRGLIAGCLGVLVPDFVYPVYDVKNVYIDDFPAPPPSAINDTIYAQYHMSVSDYYSQIWWPDMIRQAKKHNLRYTALLIVNYGKQVDPPFDWQTHSNPENFARYGKEILKQNGEVGVHGFNHQSLTTDQRVADFYGYAKWNSVSAMADSLKALLAFERSVFPNYKLRTYVPPSNMMDESARSVLKEALPDLTNISSSYLEDAEHVSYTQDFGLRADGIVDLPRVTDGFAPGVSEEWSSANTVTAYGLFSHFVHPDDSYDPERSEGFTWEQLDRKFDSYLSSIDRHYGWLRSTVASEASDEVERVAISTPVFEHTADGLHGYINGFTGPQYFILRTDKRIAATTGCTSTSIDDGVYLIRAERPTFLVKWKVAG